ncbi:MAG: alpha-amylase, partial [Bacteroidales bacterium]|nr:alpha-amylase [Bacteroidales bacterium]
SIPLGNHDNARINVKRTDKDLEMIYAFGLTMPGLPFIYYGNEIGMRQLYGMPNVEGAYPPRSGNRTPMQWAPGENLGFSTADPELLYLPVDIATDAPNVADQENNPNSLLNKFRHLTNLKRTEPALTAYAEFVPVYAVENTYPLVYARANNDEVVLCIFNPANRNEEASFELDRKIKRLKLLAGDNIIMDTKSRRVKIEIAPVSYAIYKIKF